MKYKKFTVNTPLSHGDSVRNSIANASGGRIGNYSHCSFSVRGIGRCRPNEGSNPQYGSLDTVSCEDEEKIESFCLPEDLPSVVEAVKKSHPYEEPAISVWDIEIF